ncbi:unnamed protein product, partial [Vitis vinifera]
MDCNKEEAVRAKGLAEKKMQNKDFVGARKIAIKAQQLYPDLENISQMLTVCDVHCSAEHKLIGNEIDWYAQRVLLDREKRSLHDMRRKACMKPKAAHQTQPRANKNVNFGRQSGVQNSSMNNAATTYAGPAFPQQKPVPNQDAHKVGPQSTFQKPASNVGFQGKFGAKSPGKVNGKKRKKQEVESSESCDTGSSSDTEELVMEEDDDLPAKQNYGQKSEDVSLKENICKINKQAGAAADVEEDKKDSGQKGTGSFDESLPNGTKETKKDNGKETVTDDACKRKFYEYPDPDFNDFDKDRKEECFTVGQTWALRITWLEPDPSDEAEIEWVSEDLPYSCGNFKRGKSENTGDRLMFSHLVSWEKDRSRDAYKIHPRKGETWALFKNWDIKWSSDPESHRKYEFEYVEVLSEYDENVGISVVYLSKLKGFACLFCRILKQGIDSILIPPSELLRFSHRIPSFKLTGEERQDVPRGSLELDPASLPANVEEIPVPEEDLKMEASNANSNGSNGNPDDILKDHSSDPASVVASTPEAYEIPEPDFCNFDAEKSPEKFQVGQIWALYSDEDGLPKYYSCSPPNDMIQWLDKKMLTTCGRFKIKKGKPQTYTSEVWALYKNWNAEMTCSDLENCEYDIVEVLDENDLWIEVLLLERVEGYNAVFKSQVEGRLPFSMKIPRVELLRFSHQIPAFHLTEERDGALKGNLELDPASLPILLFCSN